MWMTVWIAGSLFAGMIAILAFGYQQIEKDERLTKAEAPPAKAGHCVLCEAPLRRATTSDQVVFEIEHRIDAELQEIVRLMRNAPDGAARLYQN